VSEIGDFLQTHPYLPRVLLAGVLVSISCGVMGCFIILRRMAFLGDALAHAMLAGVTCGYLIMKLVFGVEAHAGAMLVGSVLAGLVTVGMIGFVSRATRIKDDTAIGIMYTGIFAFGGLLASRFSDLIHVDLLHFVTGQVLAVETADLWVIGGVACLVVVGVILFFRTLQLTSFDPIMAASIGIPVVAVHYALTGAASLVVVSAVNVVGVVLVVGMLVTPAATAYLLSDRLQRMLVLSAMFAVSSFLAGFALSEYLNVAPGSSIVLVSTTQFLVVLIFAPRYGMLANWLRKRAIVPQSASEDILGALLRGGEQGMAVAAVSQIAPAAKPFLEKAIRALERDGLIVKSEGLLRLTDPGTQAARKLVRAHRLWETYLNQVGAPPETLHAKAHALEHLHDDEAVRYIDDKLGHPLRDPHGSPIPADELLHVGSTISAALLREGVSAVVASVVEPAPDARLREGVRVTSLGREAEDERWRLRLADGSEVSLTHAEIDQLLVKVVEAPIEETSSH
jgi:ABC-type Mn2+/Zn2+ transport system permease subunit/Mn-dependent DtxR family transcriptional regulator